MKDSKESIMTELDIICAELKKADISKYPEIKGEIIDLLDRILNYFATQDTVTPWQKEQIIHALSGIFFSHLSYSVQSILLMLEDPQKISPNNKYIDEITNLTLEDIRKLLDKVKKHM